MRVLLATLALNEMEWLPELYAQHRNWPGLVSWVFVEAVDEMYLRANRDMVSDRGLSTDGTSEYLTQLAATDFKVSYVPLGVCGHPTDPAQGKVSARNCYLRVADEVKPDLIIVVDADEFYTHKDQGSINGLMRNRLGIFGVILKQRHIWRPHSIHERPLFNLEVTGGYWDVTHCRVWRWRRGMRYANNHNTPEGYRAKDMADRPNVPQCVHMGFASSLKTRAAKHRYYVQRGEGVTDHRQRYVDCRAAYETWKPGDTLPHGAVVKPYNGPVPEVFKTDD